MIEEFLVSQRSPRTRRGYSSDLASFLLWLRDQQVGLMNVQRPDVDRYRAWMEEHVNADGEPAPYGRPRYAPATVARRLSAVRAFYEYLVARNVLAGSPAAGAKGPHISREPRGRAVSDDQVRALLAAAVEHSPVADAMVCLLVLNGLRVSEVCRIDIEDIQREGQAGHSIRVHGKGGKQVAVALNERTDKAVRAVANGRRSGPLLRRQDGRRTRFGASSPWAPYNQQSVSRLLLEVARAADILGEDEHQVDNLHPHRLRASFITLLLDRGVSLAAVQDAARHASSDTTRIYDRDRSSFQEHPTHKLVFE